MTFNSSLERWLWRFQATMRPEGFYARPDTYPPLPRVPATKKPSKPKGSTQEWKPQGNRKQRRTFNAMKRKR